MKLSIDLNDELIAKAQQLTGIKTKKAIVDKALRVLLSFDDPQDVIDLIGNNQNRVIK